MENKQGIISTVVINMLQSQISNQREVKSRQTQQISLCHVSIAILKAAATLGFWHCFPPLPLFSILQFQHARHRAEGINLAFFCMAGDSPLCECGSMRMGGALAKSWLHNNGARGGTKVA